jgi:hypothetical protein
VEQEGQDTDLTDLLGELRVLLPGAQTLMAFLVILPFQAGFAEIRGNEKRIYVITFLCSVLSLVLFVAPAALHRLQRPLNDRAGFKDTATRFVIAGLVPLSIAITLATQLVLSTVVSVRWISWSITGIVGLLILALWWIVPYVNNDERRGE